MMPCPESTRWFDDNQRRAFGAFRWQIPRRGHDESSSVDRGNFPLRARRPILIWNIVFRHAEGGMRSSDCRCGQVAIATVRKKNAPVEWRGRRIGGKWESGIPQAAWRQGLLGEILRGYRRELVEGAPEQVRKLEVDRAALQTESGPDLRFTQRCL